MPGALLDTTFFIDYHRGDTGARSLWLDIGAGTVSGSFSPVTVFELWIGMLDRREELTYRAMLTTLSEAPLTAAASEMAALWLREMPPRAAEAVIRDAFIAATATVRGEAIYTRNTRDYTRFHSDVRTY